jgi:hypothetical protein
MRKPIRRTIRSRVEERTREGRILHCYGSFDGIRRAAKFQNSRGLMIFRPSDLWVFEEHPHETLSKTSSSVRKPHAAAYGIVCRRSCWNRSRATCRFSAVRITSLLVRPEHLHTSSRIVASSSSIRTVMAFPFMCDIGSTSDVPKREDRPARRVYLAARA